MRDRDFAVFLAYARTERSLDASQRAGRKYGRSKDYFDSLDSIRALNKKMLFRETRRG